MRHALLAALVCAAAPATAQQAALQPNETLLEVQAEGSVRAVPDRAEIEAGVTSDGATAKAAFDANAVAAQKLIDALLGAGVDKADIRTRNLTVGARFAKDRDGDDTDQILGYRAGSRLGITIRDVAKASAVLDALTDAGAKELDGPTFSFADEAPLRKAARAKAVAAATEQADDYAKALGMRRTRVLRVSERGARSGAGGDIIVTARRRTGGTPLLPGEQETSVTVWIDYALTPAG